jgi:hypothetical protein
MFPRHQRPTVIAKAGVGSLQAVGMNGFRRMTDPGLMVYQTLPCDSCHRASHGRAAARETGCTRMLEAGEPFSVVAMIMG